VGVLYPDGETVMVPVTLVPRAVLSRILCVPVCWVSIPHGFAAVVSRCGADVRGDEHDGSWGSGGNCFPPWSTVHRLVTRQLIIFDAPVKECKTKDNITVNLDVLIEVEILDAITFIYTLGPEKLDDLLRASQEEVLRHWCFETPVANIYDLHGNSDDAVARMNKTFETYGVRIHNFTVKHVSIPPDMAQDFEEKTLYDSRTIEIQHKQESDKLHLNNEEARLKLKEECDNLRMATEEQTITKTSKLSKEVRWQIASTDKDVALKNAERAAKIADMEAQAELEIARLKAETLKLKREVVARCTADTQKVQAEAEAYSQEKCAQGASDAAGKVALGKIEIAEAEGSAAEALIARRAQEQDWERLNILDKMANNKKIMIVTSHENNMGLAPDNSLVDQMTQQGMEAVRMKLAQMTHDSSEKLNMGTTLAGGLVRPAPNQQKM